MKQAKIRAQKARNSALAKLHLHQSKASKERISKGKDADPGLCATIASNKHCGMAAYKRFCIRACGDAHIADHKGCKGTLKERIACHHRMSKKGHGKASELRNKAKKHGGKASLNEKSVKVKVAKAKSAIRKASKTKEAARKKTAKATKKAKAASKVKKTAQKVKN